MARSEKKSPPTRSSPSTRRRLARPAALHKGAVSTAAAAVGRAVVNDAAENSLAASQSWAAWLAQWQQLNSQALSFWSEALRGMGQQAPLPAWNWAQWGFAPADWAPVWLQGIAPAQDGGTEPGQR